MFELIFSFTPCLSMKGATNINPHSIQMLNMSYSQKRHEANEGVTLAVHLFMFYSAHFVFCLLSQRHVISVMPALKETFELSHLSLNGCTELCPLPLPVSRGRSASVPGFHSPGWGCCRRLVISTGTVDGAAGDTQRGSAGPACC